MIFNRTTARESAQALRFREAALPHLDAVYTLARYLLRNPHDAEDAAQECYLRALRHFDSFRGESIKPWLFAILRNICHAEFGRRARVVLYDVEAEADDLEATVPLWHQEQESPETELLRRADTQTVQRLVAALPEAFREVIVLREIEGLSYRDIAGVVDAPIGTVMSRLARARAMLREAWLTSSPEPVRQDDGQERIQGSSRNQNQQAPIGLANTHQEHLR